MLPVTEQFPCFEPRTVQPKLQSGQVHLRILATSDLHMHLVTHDYHTDQPCLRQGLALTASLIAKARAEVPDAVLLDNGDFLQGNPLGDYVAQSHVSPHPMIQAMAHLQYDAVNIGNHEFSHGLDTLIAATAQAPFPCLSANTHPVPGAVPAGLLTPWTIVIRNLADTAGQRHTVRIGVIGVLPPETAIWDRQAIAGRVRMSPMATAVAENLQAVRDAGADVVVVLAHCDVDAPYDGSGPGDGARRIAALHGVDAVVMGHVHMVFPSPDFPNLSAIDPVKGTLCGKPAVMPGFFGSHLGVIDLYLEPDGPSWRVAGHTVEARSVARRDQDGMPRPVVQPDPGIVALTDTLHAAALTWARRPIGQTPRPIHSYFSLVGDGYALQIINSAQADFVARRLDGGALAHLPVLSATAPYKAGGRGGPENFTHIPAGTVLFRHAADLYIHPNTIMALRLTGRAVQQWLEKSVQIYNIILPGCADQPLINPNVPSFLCDTISGVTYEVDVSAHGMTAGQSRIRNLRFQGQPIDPDQDFILATNSYRGSGSGGYSAVDSTLVVLADQTSNREILIDYLSRTLTGIPLPPMQPAWRFAPLPGTSVVFDTSPDAAPYIENHPHLRMTPLSQTADGFLQVRLSL